MPNNCPRLLPVRVAWMISPSGGGLHLDAVENDSARVFACVSILLENVANRICKGVFTDHVMLQDAKVELEFQAVLYAAMTRGWSDHSAIKIEDFDMTDVPFYGGLVPEDPTENIKQFNYEWANSGICPDSGFYIVENSNLLPELVSSNDSKHYILTSEDVYIEIVSNTEPLIKLGKR